MVFLSLLCENLNNLISLTQAEGSTSHQEGFEAFEQLTPGVQTNDYINPPCSNFKRNIIILFSTG